MLEVPGFAAAPWTMRPGSAAAAAPIDTLVEPGGAGAHWGLGAGMMRGRIVKVYDSEPLKAFDVAVTDPDAAIAAVRSAYPELARCRMDASARLSATAIAYLELNPGEVRERFALDQVETDVR